MIALSAVGTIGSAARAENADISVRRAAERTSFSNDEIKDGFFKTAFHAELQLDGPVDRIRKFDGPVRIYVINHGAPDRRADIDTIVADIHARVEHLDLAITNDRRTANVVVMLVRRRDLTHTIQVRYGRDNARKIQQSLKPECLSGIARDRTFRIRRAEVILPVDQGEFAFYDCAYEELLQALGIINDDNSVPWTMFNDSVQAGFFDVYDQYLVNLLYDPRIRPGMTRADVARLLPEILPTVRAWVTRTAAHQTSPQIGPQQHDLLRTNAFAPESFAPRSIAPGYIAPGSVAPGGTQRDPPGEPTAGGRAQSDIDASCNCTAPADSHESDTHPVRPD